MRIEGTVRHVALGVGFWGIETATGEKWRPLELPTVYQREGLPVRAVIERLPDVATAEMWGEVCRLISVK